MAVRRSTESGSAHVRNRFTMVSSLSSALPLDSPRFSSLFFISSCRDASHQPLKQAALR